VLEVEDGLLIEQNATYLRGRDGVETRARSAWLITIRDGQQTSLTLYQTKQEALEAAGLSE
jgi:ketosteroid isomerase-like protein